MPATAPSRSTGRMPSGPRSATCSAGGAVRTPGIRREPGWRGRRAHPPAGAGSGKVSTAEHASREGLRTARRGAEGATSPEPLRHQDRPGASISGVRSRGSTEGEFVTVRPSGRNSRPRPRPGRLPMEFAQRHIGPAGTDQAQMLATVGYASLDELTEAALPAGLGAARALDLPAPLTEDEALAELRRLGALNTVAVSMIGLGYYGTHTPAVIRRNLLENPAWYTAYTPYQPEISQGRLEALLNFQTMVEDLTGLPVAGASMLDEASAAAEAMTLARRARGKGSVFIADSDCLPQTLAVLQTRAEPLGIRLVTGEVTTELIESQPDGELFGVLLQYPGASGGLRDLRPLIGAAKDRGALTAVAADLLALTLITPPGELGADIAVGSTQRFGVPMGFGGPQAGYICVADGLKRQLPGRLVGVSVDADGHPAYRLALQAREQHIRREKATSNICTAQVLLAVIAAMYASYHGPDGLASIARRTHRHALTLAGTLKDYGLVTVGGGAFDTIGVQFPGPSEARKALARAKEAGDNPYDAGNGGAEGP